VSGGNGRKNYLVECYWPGVSEQKLAVAVARAHAAAWQLRREGGDSGADEAIDRDALLNAVFPSGDSSQ
jgi:hypothetical protein